ncbi:MAG: AmmeMemoRadiSam system radical SAM enzyme [Candidatus Thorarchaeota archaeon]
MQIPEEIMFSPGNENGTLMCKVCPKACILQKNEVGYCGIRVNNGERIISKTYGKTTGISIDPIEKKPLYHFQPGSDTLSIGGIGCNLSCKFCQNYTTSQERSKLGANFLEEYSPEEIISITLKRKLKSISVTYNEPTINFEYVVDIAQLAHDAGLKLIAVTNGFLQTKSAEFLSNYLDAANVDFKGDKDFYRNICDARQTPVKKSIETWMDKGVHIEITTLVVPRYNDSEEFITGTVTWIADRLGKEVPLHFSRFFPMYQLTDAPPTPIKTLVKCKKIATEAGLKYVYIGNVGSEIDDNTYCPHCNAVLVERGTTLGFTRKGYSTKIKNYDQERNKCTNCGEMAPFSK